MIASLGFTTNDAHHTADHHPRRARLARNPVERTRRRRADRSWTWLATWWKHYGAAASEDEPGSHELHVIAVYDETVADSKHLSGSHRGTLIDRSSRETIAPLGSGEVCTDHLVAYLPADRRGSRSGGSRVAEYLAEENEDWDCLELQAVDVADPTIEQLIEQLETRECLISRRVTGNTWLVDLPSSWAEYEQSLTPNNRRSIRRMQKKVITSGRTERHVVTCADDFEPVWNVFVDLHRAVG